MWGSPLIDAGAIGHINADSGIGEWSEGVRLLTSLMPVEDADAPLWDWKAQPEQPDESQRALKR